MSDLVPAPPPSPKVFLTGGSGFVGRGVLGALVGEGREVVALSRSPAASAGLEALGATPVPGDVLDEDALASGMAGCEVVYHAAGMNAFCLADPSPLFRVNVQGSLAVVRAAARAGVRRIVYTSSASTLGEAPGTVGREDAVHRGEFMSAYERSKYQAELAVLGAAPEHGVEVVSVNPSSVQGPGRTGGTARILIDYLNGRLKFFVDTRLSLVDIADCSAAHLLAETRGVPGERYVVNGACLTSGEALEILSRVAGVRHRVRTLPPGVAMAGAAAVEGVARLLRKPPPVCREQARAIAHGHTYDGSRASRELGLVYTPIEETLRRTVAWYVEHGYVRIPGAGGP
jgi:dihydroflavonol-4-reductase